MLLRQERQLSAEGDTGLKDLLSAVQRRDTGDISKTFIAWAGLLDSQNEDVTEKLREAAVLEARSLPVTTLSEILRSVDPVLTPEHDIAHGLRITWGDVTVSDHGKLLDNFGIRVHHRKVLGAVKALVAARSTSQHSLLPGDYEMALRCAGAAGDYQASKDFWTAMGEALPSKSRTTKPWNEFIKSRFWTEPMYYQYDRARVAVTARSLHRSNSQLQTPKLLSLDRIRLSINALKHEPWNRRRDEIEEDMMRLLRRRGDDFRGFPGHWARSHARGRLQDEEMVCAALVAFSRSSSLYAIVNEIFKRVYGIHIEDKSLPRSEPASDENGEIDAPTRATAEDFFPAKPVTNISGGNNIPPGSHLWPTSRLLNAIVDAFGAMSHISLGTKLLVFVSQRYDVPIPPETWTNLLNWTYMCASRPFQTTRQIHGKYASTTVTPADVHSIWNTMMSKPYNVTPSFDAYSIYIKTLIVQGNAKAAVDLIREHAVPRYEAAAREYETAVCDEVLQRDAGGSMSRATRRRQVAETHKDHLYNTIACFFTDLLLETSQSRLQREGRTANVFIPDLIAEFGEFFHHQVHYRVAHGEVTLNRPAVRRRFHFKSVVREMLPQNIGVPARQPGPDEPPQERDGKYPQVKKATVRQWRRQPISRMKGLPWVPRDRADRGELWSRLERDMML